jgi:hypothetical protein
MQRLVAWLTALAGILFVAGTTLVPLPDQAAAAKATPIWCLVCGHYGGVDVVVNVLLFIPLGMGLRLLAWSTPAVVTTGALISLAVESLQLAVIPGRDASLSDLLTNTLGSWIGAALASQGGSLLRPAKTQALRLATAAGLAWLGAQAGTAFLLQPWLPSEPLRGEWARRKPGHPPFDGLVTWAFVSGKSVPGFWVVDSDLRRRLSQGRIHLELGLVSGRNVPRWSPVFELLGPARQALAVEAVGTDLVFQPPARTSSLRLRGPALRLTGALPDIAGRVLQLAAGERDHTLWATWMRGESQYGVRQALSPSFGWSLLLPFDYAYGAEVHLLTALWLAGLLMPVGYWAHRSAGKRYTRLGTLAALLLTGIGVIPLVSGYPPVHWSEWVAGSVGLGIGWASARGAAYFGGRCDSPSIKESC